MSQSIQAAALPPTDAVATRDPYSFLTQLREKFSQGYFVPEGARIYLSHLSCFVDLQLEEQKDSQ